MPLPMNVCPTCNKSLRYKAIVRRVAEIINERGGGVRGPDGGRGGGGGGVRLGMSYIDSSTTGEDIKRMLTPAGKTPVLVACEELLGKEVRMCCMRCILSSIDLIDVSRHTPSR